MIASPSPVCACGCARPLAGGSAAARFIPGHRTSLLKALAGEAAPLAFAGLDHSIYRAAWVRASGEDDRAYIRWVAKMTKGCTRPAAQDRVGVDGAPLEVPIRKRKDLLMVLHQAFWLGREIKVEGYPGFVTGVPENGWVPVRMVGGQAGFVPVALVLDSVPLPLPKLAEPVCGAGHYGPGEEQPEDYCSACLADREAAKRAVHEELNLEASAAMRHGRNAIRLRDWGLEARKREAKKRRGKA